MPRPRLQMPPPPSKRLISSPYGTEFYSLCWLMLAPPQSLQMLRGSGGHAGRCQHRPRSPCSGSAAVMVADAGAPAVLAFAPAAVMLADVGASRSPCIGSCGGCARTSGAPSAVRSPAASLSLSLSPPCPTAFRFPLLHRIVGLLPRRVAVSPLLVALTALAPMLPVPAPLSPFPPRPQCAARCELHGRRHASGGGARKIVVLTGVRTTPCSARGKGEVNRGGGIGGACPPAARRPGKGPQVHWAQQWAGVRPTDSPRARSPIKTVCQLPVMM
jgi:hypothetical protein